MQREGRDKGDLTPQVCTCLQSHLRQNANKRMALLMDVLTGSWVQKAAGKRHASGHVPNIAAISLVNMGVLPVASSAEWHAMTLPPSRLGRSLNCRPLLLACQKQNDVLTFGRARTTRGETKLPSHRDAIRPEANRFGRWGGKAWAKSVSGVYNSDGQGSSIFSWAACGEAGTSCLADGIFLETSPDVVDIWLKLKSGWRAVLTRARRLFEAVARCGFDDLRPGGGESGGAESGLAALRKLKHYSGLGLAWNYVVCRKFYFRLGTCRMTRWRSGACRGGERQKR